MVYKSGRATSSSFILSYYKANYSDLTAAFGSDNLSYFIHYMNYGKLEGRIATYLITSSTDDTSSDTDTDTDTNTDTDTDVEDDDEDSSIIVYSDEAYEMLELINDLRTSVGVSTLSWSDELEEYAIIRAKELVETGITHYRPDGTYGGAEWNAGEIIAGGTSSSASEAYSAWYNSSDHYSVMIRSFYGYMASACVYSSETGSYYWVTLFWQAD